MTHTEKLNAWALLLAAHYHLMDNPRFWYDRDLKDASRILCSLASDLRVDILKEEEA
jgi:hypothetical protein